MRESEFCVPASNKAVISITPSWYDRRALDTHADYALFTSLSHLASLAQSSPKVRESLSCDGGLERLIRILKTGKLQKSSKQFQALKWQQALLCVVNVGVRGSELVRNRVVESDIVPVLVTILCNALENIVMLQRYREASILRPRIPVSSQQHVQSSSDSLDNHYIPVTPPDVDTEFATVSQIIPTMSSSPRFEPADGTIISHHITLDDLQQSAAILSLETGQSEGSSTDLTSSDAQEHTSHPLIRHSPMQNNAPTAPSAVLITSDTNRGSSVSSSRYTQRTRAHTIVSTYAPPRMHDSEDDTLAFHRQPASWDQDVIWSLRLLAYLSKYPYLRPAFSRTHDNPALRRNLKCFDAEQLTNLPSLSFEHMDEDLSDTLRLPFNIFQLVEKFTMRIHADESTYWAGVIMRNSCRRHDSKGGVRQCAYLECGKWEEKNKQFAKCRRCRRTKYCSKSCQSKAWKGHRYWCQQLGERGEKKDTVDV